MGSTPARHEQPLQALDSFQAGSVIPLVWHAEVPEEGGTRREREVPLLHAAQHHRAGTECGGEHATRSSLLQPAAERFILTVDVDGGDLDNNVGQVILLQPAAERFILTVDVDGDLDKKFEHVGQVMLLQPAAERYILTVDVDGDLDKKFEHVGQVMLLQPAAERYILTVDVDGDLDNNVEHVGQVILL